MFSQEGARWSCYLFKKAFTPETSIQWVHSPNSGKYFIVPSLELKWHSQHVKGYLGNTDGWQSFYVSHGHIQFVLCHKQFGELLQDPCGHNILFWEKIKVGRVSVFRVFKKYLTMVYVYIYTV